MSNEKIGIALKNPGVLEQPEHEGVSFEVPYGDDKYGITLSNEEMDLLLNQGYEELIGRRALIGSSCVIELEIPDLPLFIHPMSFRMEKSGDLDLHDVRMGVGIVTQSVVNEHRGILSARRHIVAGYWESEGYEIQPPLRDPKEDRSSSIPV